MPATCTLGRVIVKRNDIRFEKAPSFDYEAVQGEPLELCVDYEVVDASVQQDQVLIRLTVQPEGGGSLESRVEVKDKPGLKDVARGTLARAVPAPQAMRLEGRFELDVDHGRRSWFSRIRGATKSFNTGDRFSVSIKPKLAASPKPAAKAKVK